MDDIQENLWYVFFINASLTLMIAIINICGNSMIVYIYYRFKSVRSMNNTIITLLALCDLLRGCVVMTTKVVNHYALSTELFEPMCSVTALISAFTFVYNPLLLALIAFIRYYKIAPWMERRLFKLTTCKMVSIVGFLILISILFSVLPFLGIGRYQYSIYHGVCFAPWISENCEFRVIFYSVVIGIAFPVLTISYTKLYFKLKKHKESILTICDTSQENYEDSNQECVRRVNDGKRKRASTHNVMMKDEKARIRKSRSISQIISNRIAIICDENIRQERPKSSMEKILAHQEYQVTKLMFKIFLAYCICWLPAAIINVIALVNPGYIADPYLVFTVTIVELKSALNPIIYGFGNGKYRKASQKLIKRIT